ncbi:MAG: hypothetical protein ACE5G7_05615, partial [Candidatus Hydrothermarchaeaceae archaeon]
VLRGERIYSFGKQATVNQKGLNTRDWQGTNTYRATGWQKRGEKHPSLFFCALPPALWAPIMSTALFEPCEISPYSCLGSKLSTASEEGYRPGSWIIITDDAVTAQEMDSI